MFHYLEGRVAETASGLAVIDINGAGFAVLVSTNTLSRMERGKSAKLYTYCSVKENSFDIYGFYDPMEKRCFELLISVSGVGPKAAMSILSTMSPESLAVSIAGGDETLLRTAPGIGKKIAQRIILELKDKLGRETEFLIESGFVPPAGGDASKQNDVSAALSVLGYSQGEISAALRKVDFEGLSVEEIIKEVLKNTLK